jgi:type IV pilus assembly protein PilA
MPETKVLVGKFHPADDVRRVKAEYLGRAELTQEALTQGHGLDTKACVRGFTLIELMVVLAVIAILALIAMPSFQDRIVREQIVEAVRWADFAKKSVAAAWTAAQTLPPDNAGAALPPADRIVSNHVRSVSVEAGAIHVSFGNQANGALQGKTLSLRPAIVEDAPIVPVSWVCGNAGPPERMTLQGANRTDIPARFLPVNCR